MVFTAGGGGGVPLFPLPPYDGDAGRLREAALDAATQAKRLADLQGELDRMERTAIAESEGFLDSAVRQRFEPATQLADDIAQAAVLFARAMGEFAAEIDRYNHVVDGLNREYEAARATRFGVLMLVATPGDTADSERVHRQYWADVEQADFTTRARLAAREQIAAQILDDAGNQAAQRLDAGPGALINMTWADVAGAAGNLLSWLGVGPGEVHDARDRWDLLRLIKDPDSLEEYQDSRRWLGWTPNLLDPPDKVSAQMAGWGVLAQRSDLSIAERAEEIQSMIDELRNVPKSMREAARLELYNSSTPGLWNDLKSGGLIPTTEGGRVASLMEKSTALRVGNAVAGKALAPIAAADGAYTFVDTFRNHDRLSTEDRVVGYVGGGSTAIAGGIATAALVTSAIPGGILVVGVAAGTVALGTLAYEHREDIADGAKWAFDHHPAVQLVRHREEIHENVERFVDGSGEAIGKGFKKIGGMFR